MSELSAWAAVLAAILLVAAGLLAVIGAIGLVRLPDFFMRMHPPAMGSTLGAGCVLVASILVLSTVEGRPVVHALLITLFLVMTAPVTAMLLARAAVYRRARREEG
jgi:multicomponent K+:H+ antiporter subunit G